MKEANCSKSYEQMWKACMNTYSVYRWLARSWEQRRSNRSLRNRNNPMLDGPNIESQSSVKAGEEDKFERMTDQKTIEFQNNQTEKVNQSKPKVVHAREVQEYSENNERVKRDEKKGKSGRLLDEDYVLILFWRRGDEKKKEKMRREDERRRWEEALSRVDCSQKVMTICLRKAIKKLTKSLIKQRHNGNELLAQVENWFERSHSKRSLNRPKSPPIKSK